MSESKRLTLKSVNGDVWLLDSEGNPHLLSVDGDDYNNAFSRLADYEEIGTVEEFKAIKQWKSDIIESFNRYDVNSVDELMKRFRELTEKAEPKKPRWHGHYFCPNCNSIVYVNCGKDIYCPKCGQRLDWK